MAGVFLPSTYNNLLVLAEYVYFQECHRPILSSQNIPIEGHTIWTIPNIIVLIRHFLPCLLCYRSSCFK